MNRIQELELTIQLLIDKWPVSYDFNEEAFMQVQEIAHQVLTGQPCKCSDLPFPHRRERRCFEVYAR